MVLAAGTPTVIFPVDLEQINKIEKRRESFRILQNQQFSPSGKYLLNGIFEENYNNYFGRPLGTREVRREREAIYQ